MTDLENIRVVNRCFKEKYHELDYDGCIYMARMTHEDRKGRIYQEGEGLIPLTHPDQIIADYIFDMEGNLIAVKEIESTIF